DGATQRAPEARAEVEADLPVVDVEQERAASDQTPDVAYARAGEARLRRDDQVSVGAPGELEGRAREAREASTRHAPVAHRPRPRASGSPDPRRGAWPDRFHGPERLEEAGEEIRAPRRVVAQVETEHRDLHAEGTSLW